MRAVAGIRAGSAAAEESVQAPANTPAPRRRLRAEQRRAQIVAAAESAFAEEGFALTTRELAARLGVTQALLYKYFHSKDELIAAVIDGRARGRDVEPLLAELRRPEQPLEARLRAFYRLQLEGLTATRIRLFVRANLDGLALAPRFGPRLTERILAPVLGELRAELGLADLDAVPMRRGERELVMALHGAMIFLAIRKHVYGMPMPDDLGELVDLQLRAYLPGALAELRRLQGAGIAASLTVKQLRTSG